MLSIFKTIRYFIIFTKLLRAIADNCCKPWRSIFVSCDFYMFDPPEWELYIATESLFEEGVERKKCPVCFHTKIIFWHFHKQKYLPADGSRNIGLMPSCALIWVFELNIKLSVLPLNLQSSIFKLGASEDLFQNFGWRAQVSTLPEWGSKVNHQQTVQVSRKITT